MASRKEHEMLFQLNAQLGSSFNATFSKAQKEIVQMQEKIKSLSGTQSNITAYQKQQSAVENTRAKLQTLQKQYDNIQREIKETEGFSSGLENKLLSQKDKVDKTKAALEEQTSKLNSLGDALKSAGVNMDNLTEESSRLTAEMDDLKRQQAETASGVKNFGGTTSEAFELIQSAVASAGLAKAYKEIYEAVADCTKASIEFESAVTGVFKTVDGTDAQLASIKQGIKDMSEDIPATTTEIAGVAEAAGQLGIATDNVLSFTRVMIDLGESTNLTADEAATSLAKFANITRTSADNYSRLGSVVVDLGNNFATTEADIVAMSTRLASAGTLAGLSEPHIMALSAAMSSVGIEAEAGGTAMTQTLSAIETAVATNSKELKEYARISGMSAKDFSAAWKSSPIEALRGFITGLGGLEEKGESAVLVLDELGLTGIRQSNMLKSLGLAAETLGDAIGTADKAWEENTALTIEAEKRYATTESRIRMMENSANNLKIAVGDALVPTLGGLVDVSGELMGNAADFIEENPTLVKSIGAFTGVLGVLTGGVIAYNSAAKIAKSLQLAKLFSVSGPAMLAITAIAGVTAGIVGIANAYENAQEEARRYGDEAVSAVESYKQAMGEADELEKNIGEWKALNETISSGAASADEVTAAKDKLRETEQWLIDNYGIYMDSDGSISDEELETLELRNEELRETARLKAEIALYNAKEKYDEAKEKVGDKQEKRDALIDETSKLAKGQSILQSFQTSWAKEQGSKEFQGLSYEEQEARFRQRIGKLNKDVQGIGLNYDFSGSGILGVDATIDSWSKEIKEKQKKINEYNKELLEHSESATEYKQAVRNKIGLDIGDIPVESMQEFAEAAKSIGEQAANAEMLPVEFEKYAAELTKAAQAAGLLADNQKVIFNADGTMNVIEEIKDGVSELDGKTVEIIADADTKTALMKIGDVQYKVLEYDKSTGVAILSADGKTAAYEIDVATGQLRRFDEEEAEAYMNANTDDFNKNIKDAKTKLTELDGKKITITAVFKSVWEDIKELLGIKGFATGTENAPPGAHWVGENGPELLWFNGGERVLDSPSSMALMRSYNNASSYHIAAEGREPLSAEFSPSASQYNIKIAPQFVVEGGSSGDIENRLQEFSDIVVGNVMDALEEAGIDAKRGAYV